MPNDYANSQYAARSRDEFIMKDDMTELCLHRPHSSSNMSFSNEWAWKFTLPKAGRMLNLSKSSRATNVPMTRAHTRRAHVLYFTVAHSLHSLTPIQFIKMFESTAIRCACVHATECVWIGEATHTRTHTPPIRTQHQPSKIDFFSSRHSFSDMHNVERESTILSVTTNHSFDVNEFLRE